MQESYMVEYEFVNKLSNLFHLNILHIMNGENINLFKYSSY